MLERPLVVGLLWGLFVGELEHSLYFAIFYELLWLDFIPVGTFIPPHMTAACFAALTLSTYFGLDTLPMAFLPLLAGLPMAWLGAKLERVMRDRLNRSYNGILQWIRRPYDLNVPVRLLAGSLASKVLANWLFYLAGCLVLSLLLRFALTQYTPFFASLKLSWGILLACASVGGMLALRLRSLYLAVGGGAVALAFLRFVGMF